MSARIWPLIIVVCVGACLLSAAEPQDAERLSFAEAFPFDTGVLRGVLRKDGRSKGLTDVIDVGTATPIAGMYGIFSHYRLLDDRARYGTAGWEWKSEAKPLADGAVQVAWTADDAHPLDMKATYRWTRADTLDLVTEVTAKKDLKGLEVFLASYFAGFEQSSVFSKDGLVAAEKGGGDWQAWVRDDAAAKLLNDGRWKRPPNPVDWVIKGALGGAMGIRRDAKTGLVALIMAAKDDCFAVLTPYGEEGHRSMYLSLFGKDFKAGQAAAARTRLVIGRGISDVEAQLQYRRAFE